jgi:acetyl esterase/lipase
MNKRYILLFFILILGALFFLKREKTEEEVITEDNTEIESCLDISYDEDCSLCTLDIYKKSDYQEKSVIVFVHGGGWKIGDKSNHTKKGEYFAKQGFAFVSINYPLYPDADYKEQVRSVAKSIKWIYDNMEE